MMRYVTCAAVFVSFMCSNQVLGYENIAECKSETIKVVLYPNESGEYPASIELTIGDTHVTDDGSYSRRRDIVKFLGARFDLSIEGTTGTLATKTDPSETLATSLKCAVY